MKKIFLIRVMFLSLFLSPFQLQATPAMFGLGLGYENIHGLIDNQANNLFARISLSKDILTIQTFRKAEIYFGFEAAIRNGFYGSLDIPDEIQNEIRGPVPIVASSPELEFLTTFRTNIGERKSYFIAKFGFDFYILKFNRDDLASLNSTNFLGYVGFGFKLHKKKEVFVLASSSIPISKLNISKSYSVSSPYIQGALLLGFLQQFDL